MASGKCTGKCGCFWLKVSEATEIFKTVWPPNIVDTARWGVCLADPCYFHVRYRIGLTERLLIVKYINHSQNRDGTVASNLIQSDICARCGDIQKTRSFAGLNPAVVPFRFVTCAHFNP